MTEDRRHGSDRPQPQLPLVQTRDEPSATGAGSRRRLDEQTRRIGRQGIAAARAELEAAARRHGDQGETRRGGAGRAA